MTETDRVLWDEMAASAGVTWQDYQLQALQVIASQAPPQRLLLYYRTGAGKTLTALACLQQAGHLHSLVIAPPSTHAQWHREAKKLGMTVEVVSHAKFRMKDFRISRDVPIIADEFHMFGGNTAAGFKKLDRAAAGLAAPIILCSATPNYNDAERCYCVQHILSPETCKGGFLNFLAQNCRTRLNPYSVTPYVDGFLHFNSAAEYLESLPKTVYVPELYSVPITDITYKVDLPEAFDTYNFNPRTGTLMTSIISRSWARQDHGLLDDKGALRAEIYDTLIDIAGNATKPIVIFASTVSTIRALAVCLTDNGVRYRRITGLETTKQKQRDLELFLAGEVDVLIGTAALATGTDGLDKISDTMVILQDTQDDALRKQLIGRILPRGTDTDISNKAVYRLVPIE